MSDHMGDRLRKAITANGIKRYVLIAKTGISSATLSRYEHGNRTATLGTVIILCDELDISIEWLVRGELRKGTKYVEEYKNEKGMTEYRLSKWEDTKEIKRGKEKRHRLN